MTNLTKGLETKEGARMLISVFGFHSFWITLDYFILFHPGLDPLLPGPDVPDPDPAYGEDHQHREHKDAHQDGDDDMARVG